MSGNFASISYPSITAVVHQAVLRAPSGLDARIIAEVAGYRHYNTMMSELSRQQGHKLGADMLLPLMDAAQSNAPLEFLARQRGGLFLPLPEPACGGGELLQSLARSIREFGEFAASAGEDLGEHPVLGVPDGRGGHGRAGAVERGAQQFILGAEAGEFVAGGV